MHLAARKSTFTKTMTWYATEAFELAALDKSRYGRRQAIVVAARFAQDGPYSCSAM